MRIRGLAGGLAAPAVLMGRYCSRLIDGRTALAGALPTYAISASATLMLLKAMCMRIGAISRPVL